VYLCVFSDQCALLEDSLTEGGSKAQWGMVYKGCDRYWEGRNSGKQPAITQSVCGDSTLGILDRYACQLVDERSTS
jgi:hypothetical protein